MDIEIKKKTTFSREDALHLQQLLTRQALSEQARDRGPNYQDQSELNNSDAGKVIIPGFTEKWRLVDESVTLYEWQSRCLDIWLKRGNGTVKVATGGGKTILALAAAQALQNQLEQELRLVIVVPTIPLMDQWRDELNASNIPVSAIGLMGGGGRVEDPGALRVLICVLNSARQLLPEFVRSSGWSEQMLLVVDECHRSNAEQARRIFECHPKYTLGLSATPETGDGDDTLPSDSAYALSEVGKALGPIIFEFSLRDSLEAGLLTSFEVWHIGLLLTAEESAEHSRLSKEISELRKDLQNAFRRSRSTQGFIPWCQTQASRKGDANSARFIGMSSERKRLIYSAKARTEISLRILDSMTKDEDRKAIVFHESIDEIDRLFLLALEHNIPAVLEHSDLPKSLRKANIEAFRQGVARTIISAKSLVEGFNVPSADLGIIAASSGSVRQRIQSLGRMLRRKEDNREAIIFVLYVRDTGDEEIYAKADWESVIGAERNRYFEWVPADFVSDLGASFQAFTQTLEEVFHPPREFRPPCNQVGSEALVIGEPYPAQTTGVEMKVDHSGNLRLDDGTFVLASKDTIRAIIENNRYRRAVRTPCGHLIVRTDEGKDRGITWRYLGDIGLPDSGGEIEAIKLTIKSVSGRLEIVKKLAKKEVFARASGRAETVEAGKAKKILLEWIHLLQEQGKRDIRELYWDGKSKYWIESEGDQILFEGNISNLEFPS